jgi:hypothetical protein
MPRAGDAAQEIRIAAGVADMAVVVEDAAGIDCQPIFFNASRRLNALSRV